MVGSGKLICFQPRNTGLLFLGQVRSLWDPATAKNYFTSNLSDKSVHLAGSISLKNQSNLFFFILRKDYNEIKTNPPPCTE